MASPAYKPYKSYPFRKRDPILRKVNILMDGRPATHIAEASGVSASTVRFWRKPNGTAKRKPTRTPKFATIAAVYLACGRTTIDLRSNEDD
jgi:hypothetical protein